MRITIYYSKNEDSVHTMMSESPTFEMAKEELDRMERFITKKEEAVTTEEV